MRTRTAASLVVLLAVLGAGCEADGEATSGRRRVAATVAPITSIVGAIGGERVEVTGLVPEGVDSHTFEPAPSVAAVLARADLFFANGLGLEEPMLALARAVLPSSARVVKLADGALSRDEHVYDRSFPRAGGRPNPHLWMSPRLAVRYAAQVRDELIELDPGGGDVYRANHRAVVAGIRELDTAIRRATATVATRHRTLLTYHDAFPYFARDYGWTVVGAMQPSSFDDPSPRDVARLIDQVRVSGVPAIFGSEVFPSRVLVQIGRAAGVRYVDVLRDDDLPGDAGDAEHSWLGLMRADLIVIVEALGGDAAALRAVSLDLWPLDRAEYSG